MAITVYGYRKPTLEIELLEGGSLLPNTLYYVCGYMRGNVATYANVSGPLSDIYTITTTNTHKSIRIFQKTYRNITSFEANGATTLVTSERHCLRSGEQIKITTGSYAGTYTITFVDYHRFTIPVAYKDNIPVECYTDSTRYNIDGSRTQGMMYYVSNINPINAAGEWANADRWTDAPYSTVNIANPLIVTAQPAQGSTSNNIHNVTCGKFDKGAFQNLKDYGLIYVWFNDVRTFQQIYDEVQSAGYPYNCFYNVFASTPTFYLFGSIIMTTQNAKLEATAANINLMMGEMYHTSYSPLTRPQIILNKCLVNIVPYCFSKAVNGQYTGSVVFNNSAQNTLTSWIWGDNNTLYYSPRQSNATDYQEQYRDTVTGALMTYGIVENKTFRIVTNSGLIQQSYMANIFRNVNFYMSIYCIFSNDSGTNQSMYNMENCYINRGGYTWHFRMYHYNEASESNYLKMLNVNTEHPQNRKLITHNSKINLVTDFFRRAEFYIQTESGDKLEGANITISDDKDNIYTGTTDVNGYVYIDVLEQKTVITNDQPTNTNPNLNDDTLYNNYIIKVSKAGYQDYTISLYTLYKNELLNISLSPVPDPVYYQDNLQGVTSSENIQGILTQSNMQGKIFSENLEGKIT